MKYTYDDIITAKDILAGKVKKEDIIGKRGWFTNNICPLKEVINGGNPDFLLMHGAVCFIDEYYRFATSSDADHRWNYFLPEKEESATNLRFKVGDKVIYKGKTAEVVEVDETDGLLPYLIHIENMRRWATDAEIVPAGSELREKTYKERQAEWVKANNIRVGSRVRIKRMPESYEDGWGNIAVPSGMLSFINNVSVITGIWRKNIRVDNFHDWFGFPFSVIEKIDNDSFAIINQVVFDTIQVKWSEDKDSVARGKFLTFDAGKYIAADNSSGEFFVEEFDSYQKAKDWLAGKDMPF